MGSWRLWFAIALVVGSAAPVVAEDELESARAHYRKATKAYELGLYDEAVTEYTAAYKAKDDPAILYNMAQAHRLANHPTEALALYRMFLIKVPDASNRGEIQDKINALRELIDQQKKAQSMPPDSTMPPRREPTNENPAPQPPPSAAEPPSASPPVDTHAGRSKKIAGLTLGLVGVAALGAGIAMEVLSKNASDELTRADQAHEPFNKNKFSTGKTENAAGIALLAVGGVAAVAGVVVGVLGLRDARATRVAFLPWVNSQGLGALVEVRP